jgi:hypothetical protein
MKLLPGNLAPRHGRLSNFLDIAGFGWLPPSSENSRHEKHMVVTSAALCSRG